MDYLLSAIDWGVDALPHLLSAVGGDVDELLAISSRWGIDELPAHDQQ